MAFQGEFEYSIDDRGRIPIPARYRASFGSRAVLVQGQEGSVEVYTLETHQRTSEFVIAEPPTTKKGRRVRRLFFGHSFEVDIDAQGRILLPLKLREHGDFHGTVTIVGRGECLELWNPERYLVEEAEDMREAEEGP